ncbi:MAG TPA: hypothetical protein VGK71_05955 [Nitrospirota bacterium]|jgi:hypothetical protein
MPETRYIIQSEFLGLWLDTLTFATLDCARLAMKGFKENNLRIVKRTDTVVG